MKVKKRRKNPMKSISMEVITAVILATICSLLSIYLNMGVLLSSLLIYFFRDNELSLLLSLYSINCLK